MMNYWTAQQHPTLSNKDYERNLLHPLNNRTPRNSNILSLQQQIPSPHDDQQRSKQQLQSNESPHYQYQQTLPSIHQNNSNPQLKTNTPLNVMPPLLNPTTINPIVSDNRSNNENYQNSPTNSSDKSITTATNKNTIVNSVISDNNNNNLFPLRIHSNDSSNNIQQPQPQQIYSPGLSNSSPFLYHWRGQSNNSNNHNNILSPQQSQLPYQLQMQNQLVYHVPIQPNQYSDEIQVKKFRYKSNTPTISSNNNNQLPSVYDEKLIHMYNQHSPRGSVTTMTGKNIVNSLNHSGGTSNHNLLKPHDITNTNNVSDNNMVVHVHSCHLCEKSFKRKSWLKRHLLSHSAERHFLCPWCLSRHKRKDNLLQHMKLKHYSNLLDELKNHNVTFNWEKSTVKIIKDDEKNDTINNKSTPFPDEDDNTSAPDSPNNIRLLLSDGVLNKEDVKKVLNKLIDQNNS